MHASFLCLLVAVQLQRKHRGSLNSQGSTVKVKKQKNEIQHRRLLCCRTWCENIQTRTGPAVHTPLPLASAEVRGRRAWRKIYITATLSSRLSPDSEIKRRNELPKQAEWKKEPLVREKSLREPPRPTTRRAQESEMKGKYFSPS